MAKIDGEKIAQTMKDAVDTMADAAEKVAEHPQVKNAVKMAKETAEKVAENPQVKNTAEKAKKAAKKAAETPQAKAAKATAKKVAATASKEYTKMALKETYVQVFGQEYKQSDILAKLEETWKAEGHRVSSIKSLELYIKPEDGAAYYVINGGKYTGRIDL